jgi:hypothetical protein
MLSYLRLCISFHRQFDGKSDQTEFVRSGQNAATGMPFGTPVAVCVSQSLRVPYESTHHIVNVGKVKARIALREGLIVDHASRAVE